MFDKLKSKTIIMNLFDNMHGLKGCIRCLTFKNVLLAHFLLAFSVILLRIKWGGLFLRPNLRTSQ